jgi:hypothetical protein
MVVPRCPGKAVVISELLALFGTSSDDTISDGCVNLAAGSKAR